ncbi:hypothetical protein [Mammaliicoccus sp. Dog046]|uniref:hypothetical protein n=1 Tax=Mammaliicoccus sp. Dog046 TaxID=3034233 RepID=UPI002B26021B|nr:hypothetical protein [Mammaliicoccus sp. Dog046]WQK85577.1 hypothetical protein P3U32_00695 [Mammaliicoccus sp. Dog046]
MKFKLREQDILDYLDLHFPEEKYEKGRLLVGQYKNRDLSIYYFGENFAACAIVPINTYECKEAIKVDYNDIEQIKLKDGLLFRKLIIQTNKGKLKYGTSKLLSSDFQKQNYNDFIKGEKQRVIYENGKFI